MSPGLVSYATIGILNFFSFLFSIPIIVTGVWLGRHGATACERFLDDPVMMLGIVLIIVSLAGLIGVCCRVTCLLWIYLAAMAVIIALVASFTVFVLVVTTGGTGHSLPGRGYREFRLGDYSTWFQKKVNNSAGWDGIKTCLIHSHVCSLYEIRYHDDAAAHFLAEHLSTLQSGCCKPSDDCGFSYVGPTKWKVTSASTYNNSDCRVWDNDPRRLCFDCESCKGAVLENVTVRWQKVASVCLAFLILLLLIFSIGFCTSRAKRSKSPGFV